MIPSAASSVLTKVSSKSLQTVSVLTTAAHHHANAKVNSNNTLYHSKHFTSKRSIATSANFQPAKSIFSTINAANTNNSSNNKSNCNNNKNDNSNDSNASWKPLCLTLVGASAATALLLLFPSEAQAEAATTTPTPTPAPLSFDFVNLPSATSSPSSTASSASLSKSKPPLRNPGKFDKSHLESQQTLNVQVFHGGMGRLGIPLMQGADKSVVLFPHLTIAPEGTSGVLTVVTALGHAHHLEGHTDDRGNVSGSYKYRGDSGFGFKPTFQFSKEMGDALSIETDYKAKESTTQLAIEHNGTEVKLSHMQQLTQHVSAGVQWQFAPLMASFMNGCIRIASDNNDDIFSLSRQTGVWTVSYFRKAFEAQDVMQRSAPPQTLHLATHLQVTPDGKAVAMLGLQHQSVFFRYCSNITSDLNVSMSVESQVMSGVSLGVCGELKNDGSKENKIGVSISFG